eukprot:m.118225 g.118225  ORF g.118225 m.118225 type:complete len:431 (-) comp14505_c0_seq3:22-1314(-)
MSSTVLILRDEHMEQRENFSLGIESAVAMELTEDTVKKALSGGPINIQDLIRLFRPYLHSSSKRERNREVLRELVDRLCVVDDTTNPENPLLCLRVDPINFVSQGQAARVDEILDESMAEEQPSQTISLGALRAARLQINMRTSEAPTRYGKVLPWQRRWFRAACVADTREMETMLAEHRMAGALHDIFSGYTALHWAAKKGSVSMATLAIQGGADVTARSHGGYTALHVAALSGHMDVYHHLIALGADPTVPCNNGFTPVQLLRRSADNAHDTTTINATPAPAPRRARLSSHLHAAAAAVAAASASSTTTTTTVSTPSGAGGGVPSSTRKQLGSVSVRIKNLFRRPTIAALPETPTTPASAPSGVLVSPGSNGPIFKFDETREEPVTPTRSNSYHGGPSGSTRHVTSLVGRSLSFLRPGTRPPPANSFA